MISLETPRKSVCRCLKFRVNLKLRVHSITIIVSCCPNWRVAATTETSLQVTDFWTAAVRFTVIARRQPYKSDLAGACKKITAVAHTVFYAGWHVGQFCRHKITFCCSQKQTNKKPYVAAVSILFSAGKDVRDCSCKYNYRLTSVNGARCRSNNY